MKINYWIIILSLIAIGCSPVSHYSYESPTPSWKYADLRLIDLVDVENPEQDILALYTRIQDESFQIRLDFFDLMLLYGQDIYILFDTNPGGSDVVQNGGIIIQADIQWDYVLIIPVKGNALMLNHELIPVYNLDLMISRDIEQDCIVVSINKSNLPVVWSVAKIQVFTASPENSNVTDELLPVVVSVLPPPRVKVMFLFWNVFTAESPARTLRSWYGAHSGPNSSRHGLKYILDAAMEMQTPLFFLDFPVLEDIPGLDYIGALLIIEKILKDKTINVINITNDIFFNEIFINGEFGISDYAKYANNSNDCYISTPISYTTTARSVMDCRTVLINQALSNHTTPIIIGGDFSTSRFGEPLVARQLFLYIQNHPWIQVLSSSDILSEAYFANLSSGSSNYSTESHLNLDQYLQNLGDLPQEYSVIYRAILKAPENKLTEHAIQTFAYLASITSPEMMSLAANYVHQLGHILAAARWVENPSPIASCETDPDFDGEKECILANQHIFLVVEPDGGYIPFVFSNDTNGPHLIIGPSWEFLIGMSDPSVLNLKYGIRSDPGQILGAFDSKNISNNDFGIYMVNDDIVIENAGMSMRKSVYINDNVIHFQIHDASQKISSATIPITIDPWIRYTSNWGDKYSLSIHDTGIQWGITDRLLVELRSHNQINISTFNASHSDLFYPEDPNHDYSQGHYLPYPMALMEISPSDNIDVELVINP